MSSITAVSPVQKRDAEHRWLHFGGQLLQSSSVPSLLVDGTGALFASNTAADVLFARPAAFMLDVMRRVHVRREHWIPLSLVLAEYWTSGRSSFPLVTPSMGDCVLELLAEDNEAAAAPQSNSRLVLATIVPSDTANPSWLKRRYGLSDAEARVAHMLSRGCSPQHVADATSVKLSTVRTHIQHIYEKTGTGDKPSWSAGSLTRPSIGRWCIWASEVPGP